MSRPRIVLADDYEPLTSACKGLLESEYDVVDVVASGDAALAAVRLQEPDALVLDVNMPGLSGLEVARELTRSGTRTKIVMLTFVQDSAVIEEALAAGALGYVTKTRIARDLCAAIRAALAGEQFVSRLPSQNESSPAS